MSFKVIVEFSLNNIFHFPDDGVLTVIFSGCEDFILTCETGFSFKKNTTVVKFITATSQEQLLYDCPFKWFNMNKITHKNVFLFFKLLTTI